MAIEITVPRLGWSMDEGMFGQWLKQDGEWVDSGDTVFVLEGDKAAQDIESFDSGVLRIPPEAPKPGDSVEVGQVLGFLVAKGEPAPFELVSHKKHEKHEKENLVQTASVTTATKGSRSATRNAISPRARRVARELGIDWSNLTGTGRSGRIREVDIKATVSAQRVPRHAGEPRVELAALSGKTIPITHVRRTIAERMLAGDHQTAPVTLTTKADATNLVNLGNQFRSHAGGVDVPSYTDFIVKLSASALQRHPMLLGQWRDDSIVIPDEINIALAVDVESGLLAPVVRDVPVKSLRQVADETKQLVELARDGKLTAEQMQGGTFTISNLGSYGVDAFTPIINLPQCAILGVGRILREPVVLDDEIVPRDMMSLSLTFDHRVVDGAPAARLLASIRENIEQPGPCLMP